MVAVKYRCQRWRATSLRTLRTPIARRAAGREPAAWLTSRRHDSAQGPPYVCRVYVHDLRVQCSPFRYLRTHGARAVAGVTPDLTVIFLWSYHGWPRDER